MCEPTWISMAVITDLWLTHQNLLMSSNGCPCLVQVALGEPKNCRLIMSITCALRPAGYPRLILPLVFSTNLCSGQVPGKGIVFTIQTFN